MQSLSMTPNACGNKDARTPQQTSVLIIYTGGTIGMQPGSDGSLQPCKGFLTDMIPKMDELSRPGMPRATGQQAQQQQQQQQQQSFSICMRQTLTHRISVMEFDELLDSSDMCANHASTSALL